MSQDNNTVKKYIDNNVYIEAKNRIKHIINKFDEIYVCFSGGKDSLVALHLVEEVYKELGISEKINVIFRDEEVIPDEVVDFVHSYYKSGKYNFYYYAVPLYSTKFILGNTCEYIQWDNNREWVRPKPDFAITLPEGDDRIFDQYSMDEFCVSHSNSNNIAFITGIRADESLIRLTSCCQKLTENYINNTKTKRVKLCKPIYDWSQDDIFIYLYRNNISYCPIYTQQMLNQQALRVATPLHAESSKNFKKLRTLSPTFYQQVVDIFPEMLVQERYWDEYDRYGIMINYENSWEGIYKYIDDTITDKEQNALAKSRVDYCKQYREKLQKENPEAFKRNLCGYSIMYVFKSVIAGQYKRVIQPRKKVPKKEFEYEGIKVD